MLSAWDSATRKAALPVVVKSGNVPPWPAPDQVTVQWTVAVTGNSCLACVADEVRYVWPQSGDDAFGSLPARYGVPAPVQVTVLPSPMDHDTDAGVAVAVTDTPGTDAVADTGPQPFDSHIHVGRFTS